MIYIIDNRVGVGLGGQSGCERRIEVFVKIQKKKFFFFGGGVGGELKFLWKFKKKLGGGGGGGWGGRGVSERGRVGVGGQGGCERN